MQVYYYVCLAWTNIPNLDLDGEHPVKSELLAALKMYQANLRLRQGSKSFHRLF